MLKNTAILERKGFNPEEIQGLEKVCLDTDKTILQFGISSDGAMIEDLARIIDERDIIKRRLDAVSPYEGRYDRYIKSFHDICSGFAWHKRRVQFEIEYMITLTDELHNNYEGTKRKITQRPFTDKEKERLRDLYRNFNHEDARRIELIDRKVKHDIVAMTTWIVYELGDSMGDLKDAVEATLHFPITSNDVNHNVYNSIVRDIIKEAYIPAVIDLQNTLIEKVEKWDEETFAGETHGQYAEYTTLRKVFANSIAAIDEHLQYFLDGDSPIKMTGKIGGAVGNLNDIYIAYPDHNWRKFCRKFIEDTYGFTYSEMTDQPEFQIKNQHVYDDIRQLNNSLRKMCLDFWLYCSRGLFNKQTKKGESGSSVMAQKANPWLSEGARTLFKKANSSLLDYEEMLQYRMQGDLERSIFMRDIGFVLGKTSIGIKRLQQEIEGYLPNYEAIKAEVDAHNEMSAAAVQIILRREGIPDAYDKLKEKTMGKSIGRWDYMEMTKSLVDQGKITSEVQQEISDAIMPDKNVGDARELAIAWKEKAKSTVNRLKTAYEVK